MAPIGSNNRNLKTCLQSLKCSVSRELKSEMAYKFSRFGRNSTCADQTVRLLTTKFDKNRKEDSP